jgi:hypothetical protein
MEITLPLLRFILIPMFIGMLFNPLRQIADKFNEMQLGMIAANRVLIFWIPKIKYKIQEKLKHQFLKEILNFKKFVLVYSG